MKLVNFIFALAILACGVAAQAAEPVSPGEMLRVCQALAAYAPNAVESHKAKVPLETAVAEAKSSIAKRLDGVPADVLERYQASVRALYERVYGLPDADLPMAHRAVIPACISYARGQYTEVDLQEMRYCDARTSPYLGFANLRDMGVSLNQQLEWLQREGLKNAPVTDKERERFYSLLSNMIQYVYAHPELSKRTIQAEQFESCMEEPYDPEESS